MKKIIILFILGIGYHASATTRPEAIPSKLTEVKASSWYKEKFRSWNTYLQDNPEDKAGWVEYFKAGLYGGMPSAELGLISEEIATRFEASAEAHLVKSKLQGWTVQGLKSLELALQEADNKMLLPERILLAEIKGTDRTIFTQSLYNSNLVYPSLLNYSYNVLMSVGDK